MFWTVQGAENVLIMRCAVYNRRFDAYWNAHNQTDYLEMEKAA